MNWNRFLEHFYLKKYLHFIKKTLTSSKIYLKNRLNMTVTSINPSQLTNSPFTKPLVLFHGKILHSFDRLPNNGKLVEIIKRVILIIAAPFLHLVLGCTALLSYGIHYVFRQRSVKPQDTRNSLTSNTAISSGPSGLYRTFRERSAFERKLGWTVKPRTVYGTHYERFAW